LIGLYLAFFFERILVIPLGLAGALAGVLYSMPDKGLKYHGLGEILIFITWGVSVFIFIYNICIYLMSMISQKIYKIKAYILIGDSELPRSVGL
jgi:1,4-dihydroxy-2-naphthoate octaprenyltransferase